MTYASLMALVLVYLPAELLSIQVIVPQKERSTTLFASVVLRCDYTTSANPQEVLVTWRFKSFCRDPVLEYYSTGYQAALQLRQDPTNDCPDSQRTIRTVIQKKGINQPSLGSDYLNRRITILNKADLAITEVMWWDNGVYFCTIDAQGDTTGDSDQEVKLIVYSWLTVLFIILGALLLLILVFICCCQCCPQRCCCYVRCPCCPRTCCCPEEAVMQHRMLQEAKKAMVPWMNGQPIYVPISSNASSQGVPILYSGSYLDHSVKTNLPMPPLQLKPMPLQQHPPPPPPLQHVISSPHGSVKANDHVLNYLENQIRGLDVGAPHMAPPSAQNMLPLHQYPQAQPSAPAGVPHTSGPPSMLSALDEMGVRGTERRVITLPPIIGRVASLSSRRGPGGGDGSRGGARISSQSSGSTSRSAGGFPRDSRGCRERDASPPRRGILRDYSDDLDWEDRRRRAPHRAKERGSSAVRRGDGSTRSHGDLMEELRLKASRRERSCSPPQRGRESWRSDDDSGSRRKGGRWREESEKPPSYSSIEIESGSSYGQRSYTCLSDRTSCSPTSVVI
ncbi:immunoglobulin-like domain-containing receptor 1b [Betta splendens]|uniref:immunoglobulin-like domain-containing receptor 1b n=1 Tax=Betta splendens TaxID=158456 RepID=UPI0010F5D7FE|nr:immunoglobulin-like domain-containing receptor 1b [Betta splendens]